MSHNTKNKLTDKTVVVVFPSIFSLNKMDGLMTSISNVLRIREENFTSMQRRDSVIVIEASDPVFASSTIGSLFGIERIAIAKEVENRFDAVLGAITGTSMNLLLKGEKFYVKVEGNSTDYLPKDLEIAATTSIIEKSGDLQVSPGSESNHTRLLYTYLTRSHAYVCIFVDKGLGGTPYNSQREPIVCCIYDELSAVASLQCIKLGFHVKIITAYSNDSDLLKLSKMINRMLSSIVDNKITLQFCKMPKTQDQLMKILVMTHLLTHVASSKKIKRIAIPITPFAFPAWFVEENARIAFQKNLIPWFPLVGMDSSILENSKQLGLAKYLTNLESVSKSRFPRKNIAKDKIQKNVKYALKSLRTISLTVGPKNVHDIIDSVRTNH